MLPVYSLNQPHELCLPVPYGDFGQQAALADEVLQPAAFALLHVVGLDAALDAIRVDKLAAEIRLAYRPLDAHGFGDKVIPLRLERDVHVAAGQIEIFEASEQKIEEADFLMIREGRVAFEGHASDLRTSKDPYLKAFLS